MSVKVIYSWERRTKVILIIQLFINYVNFNNIFFLFVAFVWKYRGNISKTNQYFQIPVYNSFQNRQSNSIRLYITAIVIQCSVYILKKRYLSYRQRYYIRRANKDIVFACSCYCLIFAVLKSNSNCSRICCLQYVDVYFNV